MFIRRVLPALMALAMLASFAGCDRRNESEEPDVITYSTEDESGYELWLRYPTISSSNYKAKAEDLIKYIVMPDTSREVVSSAYLELVRGLSGLFDKDIQTKDSLDGDGGLIIGTEEDGAVKELVESENLKIPEKDGYLIKNVKKGKALLILGQSDSGVLYGAFRLLEILGTKGDISSLNVSDAPKIMWRVLNQWDNWDGSIERGYAGTSIYDWNKLPVVSDTRLEDFARANASVGINTIVINNVNTSNNYIDTRYLKKVAAVADIYRKYGIRLAVSINFDAPSALGRLGTNDPLDKNVIKWWKDKAEEIYKAIPDFAGFLIKADSEGRSGPSKYSRTHAEGANMLADALKPYGGIVMWRAFVYGNAASQLSDDICNQGYEFFKPLDGQFSDNVIIQSKNGPRDFLPREPVSPLFGGMKQTNMGIEFQVTQEYTGQSSHLCYLVSMWKYYLDFDMMLDDGSQGVPTTLSNILQGKVYTQSNTLVSGVSNVGNCESWNDGLLAQANWYGFGKLAWNPDYTEQEITENWIKLTFNDQADVMSVMSEILYGSWELYQSYTSPYAMGMTFATSNHFDPDLESRNSKGTISVNRLGIGNNRNSTSKGNHTDATAQYSPALGALFDNIDTCPEELLCWFHHVPFSHKLSNGESMIENLYMGFAKAPEKVTDMKNAVESLEGKIDAKRLKIILSDLAKQLVQTKNWSKAMISFFEKQSKIECDYD